jgi:hypothetical protein
MYIRETRERETHISSSDFPPAYASAVSNIFIPASNAVLIISYIKKLQNQGPGLGEYNFERSFFFTDLDWISRHSSSQSQPFRLNEESTLLKIERQDVSQIDGTYSLLKKTLGREAHLDPIDGMACSWGRIRAVRAMIEGWTLAR